jgi:hypothetical protein
MVIESRRSGMGEISSIYRLAPPEGYVSKDASETRLRLRMRRLVNQFGQDEVIRRLRMAHVDADQEILRAWLVLSAMSVRAGQASSSAR